MRDKLTAKQDRPARSQRSPVRRPGTRRDAQAMARPNAVEIVKPTTIATAATPLPDNPATLDAGLKASIPAAVKTPVKPSHKPSPKPALNPSNKAATRAQPRVDVDSARGTHTTGMASTKPISKPPARSGNSTSPSGEPRHAASGPRAASALRNESTPPRSGTRSTPGASKRFTGRSAAIEKAAFTPRATPRGSGRTTSHPESQAVKHATPQRASVTVRQGAAEAVPTALVTDTVAPPAPPPAPLRNEPGLIRLSKRMSELGLCSRREADEWIEKGWVRVDGKRIDTLGSKVLPEQKIEVTREAHQQQLRQVTFLLHKPIGYVSGQPEDDHPPAMVLLKPAQRWADDACGISFEPVHLRALAPAGRLDIDSTGLLVFTQDGRVAKQLIGEDSEVEKEYLVRVRYGDLEREISGQFPAAELSRLRHGLELDGVALKPAKVDWLNGEQLRFILREGKKRQIRRMCELVGLQVVGLKRVRIGKVGLGALPVGHWRYLANDEGF